LQWQQRDYRVSRFLGLHWCSTKQASERKLLYEQQLSRLSLSLFEAIEKQWVMWWLLRNVVDKFQSAKRHLYQMKGATPACPTTFHVLSFVGEAKRSTTNQLGLSVWLDKTTAKSLVRPTDLSVSSSAIGRKRQMMMGLYPS
jgi:hypothetical protein